MEIPKNVTSINFINNNEISNKIEFKRNFYNKLERMLIYVINITIIVLIFDIIMFIKNKYIRIIILIILLGIICYIFAIRMNENTRSDIIAYKPIIYLYPTEETEVSIKLEEPNNITCSYPKYIEGWNVIAQNNGDLTDIKTNKNLYSLYYESKNKLKFKQEKEGFIVEGKDTAKFLEEKLAILGLTERESEEFIIYWLPKLENNQYNYIRFATEVEINYNMPLNINPMPNTIIRVLMTYKGLNKKISVNEQKLISPERKGFVVVEWGGTEI